MEQTLRPIEDLTSLLAEEGLPEEHVEIVLRVVLQAYTFLAGRLTERLGVSPDPDEPILAGLEEALIKWRNDAVRLSGAAPAALYAIAEDLGYPCLESSPLTLAGIVELIREAIARSREGNRETAARLREEVAAHSPNCPDCWHPKTSHGEQRGWECGECSCGHGAHRNTYQRKES
jgi:hypothetical protein